MVVTLTAVTLKAATTSLPTRFDRAAQTLFCAARQNRQHI